MKGRQEGLVAIEALTVAFGQVVALESVTLAVEAGSLVALTGPNGAGKSTLLKVIAGLVRPASGRVILPGAPADWVAYLPQRADIERRFPLAVADLVLTGAWRRLGALRGAGPAERAVALQALDTVGLRDMGGRPIGSLSIGQLQRALFARILVQDMPIILLDEPFAAIDVETTDALLGLLPRWRAEGRTVIAALHELEHISGRFDRIVRLERHVVAPREELLNEPPKEPFGRPSALGA